jgi:hypothetical protein
VTLNLSSAFGLSDPLATTALVIFSLPMSRVLVKKTSSVSSALISPAAVSVVRVPTLVI